MVMDVKNAGLDNITSLGAALDDSRVVMTQAYVNPEKSRRGHLSKKRIDLVTYAENFKTSTLLCNKHNKATKKAKVKVDGAKSSMQAYAKLLADNKVALVNTLSGGRRNG